MTRTLKPGQRVKHPEIPGVFVVESVNFCRAVIVGDKRTEAKGLRLSISPTSPLERA